ncbi:MAG: tRNA pseudouridine(38-40) synthase TruA [Chloroflexi bacterium]|nr:tRNA pseudouridine(38-40) synthase TruA [Chloroflexota bacterium]
MILEYDGTCYNGFQLQANAPTIQGELEKALHTLTGEHIRVAAASRTDAGVHARGQVVSFKTASPLSSEIFVKALNYHLPADIAVREAHKTDISLDVRRAATSREYSYHILNSPARSPLSRGYAYHVPGRLDIEAMNMACRELVGTHDFASFVTCVPVKGSAVRRVYRAEVKREGELVIFNIEASSFLIHQVRNTVGALIRVGLDKISAGEFHKILEAKQPGLAWPMAPACGLRLMKVNYSRPSGE